MTFRFQTLPRAGVFCRANVIQDGTISSSAFLLYKARFVSLALVRHPRVGHGSNEEFANVELGRVGSDIVLLK